MSESETIEAGAAARGSADDSGPSTISNPDEEIVVYAPDERYEARKMLGEGGMGEVRLCADRVIGREVAMKVVLDRHRARTDVRRRFEREARVQGQLEHPAIVPVYDFGRDLAGRAFFTMRRVRGITLQDVLDGLRARDEAIAAEYTRHKLLAAFVRVCLAIQYASEHGVLHRDLKPANVMLGRHGEVYVLDWGLAKVRGALDVSSPKVPSAEEVDLVPPSSKRGISGVTGTDTAVGSVLGTPQYMSPEQIRGEDLDPSSDVYALGAILFEILTLEPLHGDGTVAQILHRALHGADARASLRAPARDVPPELEAACVRAAAREPRARYGTARELADAIEAYLSGDRDLALRRELARVHFERAREAESRARVPGHEEPERIEALRETGRAIALAPDDPEVKALLVHLLTTAPAKVPDEVKRTIREQDARARVRVMPKIGVMYLFGGLAAFGLQVLLGVREWSLLLVPTVFWVLAGLSAFVIPKLDPDDDARFPWLIVFTALGLATSTVDHGVFIVIPALATALAAGSALTAGDRSSRPALLSLTLAVVVPCALAWAGVHPVRHVFDGNVLTIASPAVQMPRDATFAFLTGCGVLTVLATWYFLRSYRQQMTSLKTRMEVQGWQLRRLVPEDAADAMRRLPSDPRTATRDR